MRRWVNPIERSRKLDYKLIMNISREVSESVDYLKSLEADEALSADPYWPKWNSPWWHMLLLHEMGETALIPGSAIEKLVSSLSRMPLKIFPIYPGELPPGVDPYRGTPCHCQLGTVYQVLAAHGVDVDRELPWIRRWLLNYQMADGGMNCDSEAYLVAHETPSSMVGTIGVFEALVRCTAREFTPEEALVVDRAAAFLISRELRRGSETKHNAEEQVAAKSWAQLCFPRFYFYDTLRGLSALFDWADRTGQRVPVAAVSQAMLDIESRFPDGKIRIGRRAFAGRNTYRRNSSGLWEKPFPADEFPLLTKVSAIDQVSPFLSAQWARVQKASESTLLKE